MMGQRFFGARGAPGRQTMTDRNERGSKTTRVRRVLVPVANPNTARDLIRLAGRLADPDEGHVLALLVTVSGAENDEDAIERIEQIVAAEAEAGVPVELIVDTASSVARGILDTAREHGVELMVLGFQGQVRGKVDLGPIVEAVAQTAPCDLIVFRNPSGTSIKLEDIEHVVMPLDGSDNARVAARLGMVLAQEYNAQPTAIYVQTQPDMANYMGLARIEASLAGLSDTRKVERQVVRASDIVSGILARVDQSDMIVLGYDEQSPLDRWIFGDATQRILRQAPGPVILVKRASKEGLSPTERFRQRLVVRFSPTLTPSERTEVVRNALEMSRPETNFVVLMVVSSLLAAFGLLQSSAAVIIGAMLVAPLMSPLMAFSVGLLQGGLRLMRSAALTVLVGVLIGLAVATGIGLAFPLRVSSAEMLARGQPSLLDMGVALASGVAGAYAMARKDIPSALAGVAIAAALVPPLCTVGLAIAFGDYSLASGAGLLFLTNIVSISLAGAAVFAWLGIRPGRASWTWQQWVISVAVLLLLAVPQARAFLEVTRIEREIGDASQVLQAQFGEGTVSEVQLKENTLTATIRSERWVSAPQVRSAETALEETLGRDIDLEITYWRLVAPAPANQD